jgi:DNA-directed RNA polymerase subunit RPC12/RpoP
MYVTGEKLTRIYICRKCRKKYSIEDFHRDHFCRECGTYLTVRIVSKSGFPRNKAASKPVIIENKNINRLLPEGYEIRKEQIDFIEEATKAL